MRRPHSAMGFWISLVVFLSVAVTVPTPAQGPASASIGVNVDECTGLALRNQIEEAETCLLSILNRSPKDPTVLTNLGNLEVLRGDLELALAFYDEALTFAPRDPGILLNRALLLSLRGDEAGALTMAARALDGLGGVAVALDLLGIFPDPVPADKQAEAAALTREEVRELLQRAAREASGEKIPGMERPGLRASDPADLKNVLYWKRFGIDPTNRRPGTVVVERYPTIEAPEVVSSGMEFALEVALTESLVTPEVKVIGDTLTNEGKIPLVLPDQPNWSIDVVLLAPGFRSRDDRYLETIFLSREGDSTPAVFYLRAENVDDSPRWQTISLKLYHQGTFLARIVRKILVEPRDFLAEKISPANGDLQPTDRSLRARPIDFSLDLDHPDLTLTIETLELDRPNERHVTITSPYLWTMREAFTVPPDLSDFLEGWYGRFAQASMRGVQIDETDDAAVSEDTVMLLQSFGREIYKRFAPPCFKRALWELYDKTGLGFGSIQIISDDPTIPWELMRPINEDGSEEMDFLGSSLRLARWHFAPNDALLHRAPQFVQIKDVVVIAPSYEGGQGLPYQKAEVEALEHIPGYRALPARMASVRGLFESFPQGIIHFAGHGFLKPMGKGIAEYSIRLEDSDLDLMMWKGLANARSRSHPLVFLNACDVGQASRVANFVYGWAPAVLEAGASGYIGSLWPLSDKGAAEFATLFYNTLRETAKAEGRAVVAEALWKTRQHFYDKGDPTFLAYVYYGDPLLSLSWKE